MKLSLILKHTLILPKPIDTHLTLFRTNWALRSYVHVFDTFLDNQSDRFWETLLGFEPRLLQRPTSPLQIRVMLSVSIWSSTNNNEDLRFHLMNREERLIAALFSTAKTMGDLNAFICLAGTMPVALPATIEDIIPW